MPWVAGIVSCVAVYLLLFFYRAVWGLLPPYCTHTPMHDVAPSAVKIAVIMLARICSVHFNVSFFRIIV